MVEAGRIAVGRVGREPWIGEQVHLLIAHRQHGRDDAGTSFPAAQQLQSKAVAIEGEALVHVGDFHSDVVNCLWLQHLAA